MPLTLDQRAALHSPLAADYIRDHDVVATCALADVLSLDLAVEGYREAEGPNGEALVYRTAGDHRPPSRVNRADLRPLVERAALAALDDAADGTTPGPRRARATARLLRSPERGVTTYLRRLVQDVADRLPPAEPGLVDDAEASRRKSSRPASSVARPRRERRAATRAEDLAESRDLLTRWLPQIKPGTYPRMAVWEAFVAARDKARQRLQDTDHGALRIGERAFFALLEELGYPVTTGRARSRWVTFPAPPTQEKQQ